MAQLAAVAGTGESQDHGKPVSRRIAGVTELSVELEDGHRGHGGGTGLVRDAQTAIPSGQLVLAVVAPGNAASVRALLPAGFIPPWAPSSCPPVAGDEQHADNTNKTALPGTRRHDRHDDHASLVSENAGELG